MLAVRLPGGQRVAALLAVLVVIAGAEALFAPSADAASFVPISGSGSTWSSNALDQWRRNVASLYQITVNYAPNGSTSGRNDFRNNQADFAVSEIPYGLTDGGVIDYPPKKKFGYMPIVAGGTSFMYNLKIGGKRVTNLRLSGETLVKIFTQQITKWSDPAIKADNPQLALPDLDILPVVYSNGSGTAAQFTAWMADQYPALWDAYCHRVGRDITPCGFTSFYPHDDRMVAKAQSQGVSGFVRQDSSEGAITFVEYSYARNAGFPVAKVLNKANYYVEPTAGSVAVALLKAKIRDDLTQDLTQVYINDDPRTYPLSSYSYMILPKDTSAGSNFTEEKGRTLSEFAAYFLCEGQQQADLLGYSPLPINLVQAGADQINEIPGSTKKLDRNNLAHCNNPTVSPDGGNKVAEDAPQPQPCDAKGPTQCATGTGGAKEPTRLSNSAGGGGAGGSVGGAASSGGDGGSSSTAGTSSANSGDATSAGTVGGAADGAGGGATSIDPDTGQVISEKASASDSGAADVSAVPVSVGVADSRRQTALAALTIIVALALVLAPPLITHRIRIRAGPGGGHRP
ncbi:MAG TPA: phosphate ABC transporter substrate-binding protein PstS [Pseudonocardiaceae bacterium]|nr:phosphate ABC transporter substrate-binding protein PstS [Pseudonocardiaceae bacterium]